MENSLQKKVTLTSLVRYTLPTIAMMIFFSFYPFNPPATVFSTIFFWKIQ